MHYLHINSSLISDIKVKDGADTVLNFSSSPNMTKKEIQITKNTFGTSYAITFDKDPSVLVIGTSTSEGTNGARAFEIKDGKLVIKISADSYCGETEYNASTHTLRYYCSRGGSWIKFSLYFSDAASVSIT